jgi:hypothetical protein
MIMSPEEHVFTIKVEGLPGGELSGKTQIHLMPGDVGSMPLNLKAVPWELKQSRTDIRFIATRDDGLIVEEESRFIGPAGR